MSGFDEMTEAILAAVLAVNRYPLEKVLALLPRLKEAGLTGPSSVVSEDLARLTVRLASAGYDRGLLTWRLAERVQQLMVAVGGGLLESLSDAVRRNDYDAARTALCNVRGIGPQVARNAWLLLRGETT
jgi:hypothetical protein